MTLIVETAAFTVSGPASKLKLRAGTMPTTAVASVPLSSQPFVELWVQPCGTEATSECLVTPTVTGTMITASVSNGEGRMLGSKTAQVVNGVAIFTDLAVTPARASAYDINFEASGMVRVSSVLSVNPGAATSIAISTQPTLANPGEPFNCAIELRDLGGQKVTAAVSVTISLADDFGVVDPPTLRTSQDSLTKSTSSGDVSWSGLQVDRAPAVYSFLFSATLSDETFISVISRRIALQIGALAEFRIIQGPLDVQSGVTMRDLIVNLYDAGGNLLQDNMRQIVTVQVHAGTGTLNGVLNQVTCFSSHVLSILSFALCQRAWIVNAESGKLLWQTCLILSVL